VTKLRAEKPRNRGSVTDRGLRVLNSGWRNRYGERLPVGQAIA